MGNFNIDWSKLLQDNAGDLIKGGIGLYGAASNAAAQNKSANANLNVARSQAELEADNQYQNQLLQQAQLDMQRKQADEKAKADAQREILLAGLQKDWAPTARPEGVANIDFVHGGITPEMKAAAEARRLQATNTVNNGLGFTPMVAPKRMDLSPFYAQQQQEEEKKKSGNLFGKILKGVGMGASFIPGVGQIVAPIATGLGGLVNGDGLKKSILEAGMSAIPAGVGKLAKASKTAKKIAAAKNAF